MGGSWRRLSSWLLPLLLLAGLLGTGAAPASAQPLSDYLTLNSGGGQNANDGLRITFGDMRYQVERNGNFQVYNEGTEAGTLSWIVVLGWNADADIGYEGGLMCYASGNANDQWGCNVPNPEALPFEEELTQSWNKELLEIDSSNPKLGRMNYSENWNPLLSVYKQECEFTLYTSINYTSPNPYADVTAQLAFNDTSSDTCEQIDSVQLYLAADMYLDGNDDGPSVLTEYQGARVVAQINETGVGGFREVGTPWTSFGATSFPCLFGATEISPLPETSFTCDVPEFNTGLARGMYYGERYPDLVEPEETDAGVGVHWDLTANRTQLISTQIFFAPADIFGGAEVAECELTPDMAVSPQLINLAPGGTATVEVAMRNLCNDKPYRNSDLLVSFSDGLRVIGGSDGMLNLGQRAAWQGFTLQPGETRRWTVTVQADGTLTVAPVHISELYHRGRVASRIDGVFITPAPAPAPVVAPTPAPAPVVVAEPAPLPAALPNTSGGLGIAGLLMGAVSAAGLMLAGRRIKR